MSADDSVPLQDKIIALHTRKDEKGKVLSEKRHEAGISEKDLYSALSKIPERRFCFDCGGALKQMLIFYCSDCGQRYLVEFDETVGKPILVPLGQEKELIKPSE